MCGIAGKVWFDPARPAARELVGGMTDALRHRGPDDHGVATEGAAAFGHRRLAIVDLSPRGRQPMRCVDDERLLLVVNGEIYNHAELRADLTARGHRFASACDSEVVLPLYREWYAREGPAFVDRLDGMFAFALWDGAHQRLVLGRDRTGQKPLVYCATDAGVSFASELGALRHDPDLDRTLDDRALADYLAFRAVPHPRSVYRGASKLPPASVLVAEGGAVATQRYWCLAAGPDDATSPPFEEAVERVRDGLGRAVRRRLMSDVPVGALLSGGVDSAAVVAHMADTGGPPVRTFTIGFDDPAYDETADARRVARLFGTDHTERLVAPDAVGLLDLLAAHYGEPFADSSALPTWLVSELAAGSVKVVLTGDGGDEAFAGYDRYRALALAGRLRRPLAAPLRAGLRLAAGATALTGVGGQRSVSARLRRFVEAVDAPPREANDRWRRVTSPPRLASLLTETGRRRLLPSCHYGPDSDRPLPLNEALVLDVERYLPDDLLVKLDVASMAHSLEARSPFLDRDLLELALDLPARHKLAGRLTKRVLRAALAGRLPADVLAGPKRGFGVPLDRWFAGPLLGHAREVLLSERARARDLFDAGAVESLLAAHARREVAAHETLFTLLVLERWLCLEETSP